MHRRTWLGATSLGLLQCIGARGEVPASAPGSPGSPEHPLQIEVAGRMATNWVGTQLLMRIYAHAKLAVRIYPVPIGRAARDLQAGLSDGDGVRIFAYGEGKPEALRVEPAFYRFTGHAYSLPGRGLRLKTVEDLQHLRVGAPANTFWVVGLIANLPQVFQAQTHEQLYRMMELGRVDLVLDTQINGRRWSAVTRTPLTESTELGRFELYHYLHRSHVDLVPRLSGAIRSMQASGELQRLIEVSERVVMTLGMDQFD